MVGAAPPPASVLASFRVPGEPVSLPGGQGGTWRAGDVVLKPTGFAAESEWRAGVLAVLPDSPRFRVARPIRSRDGGWTSGGWEAWHAVAGEPDLTRPDEVLTVGLAFHRALAGLPRPEFLDRRDDPWTYGERVAFGEAEPPVDQAWAPLLGPLLDAVRPVDLPTQPVHGDLLGNVLFADGLPPAVIDWPVYFRPVSWALAVAVVDAHTWYGAPAGLVGRWAHLPAWRQMVIRALLYRIATNEGSRRAGRASGERPADYLSTVEIVLGVA